jgi:hypothetical protein
VWDSRPNIASLTKFPLRPSRDLCPPREHILRVSQMIRARPLEEIYPGNRLRAKPKCRMSEPATLVPQAEQRPAPHAPPTAHQIDLSHPRPVSNERYQMQRLRRPSLGHRCHHGSSTTRLSAWQMNTRLNRDVASIPSKPHTFRVRKTKHREESTGTRRPAVPDPPGNQDAQVR